MKIQILNKEEHEQYYDEILALLVAGDDEFVPPLSARSSTTQANLSGGEKVSSGVESYFEEMKKQRIMIATENGKLVAFVSYKENYEHEKFGADALPNIYLSTLIVSPAGRGHGLTQKMYTQLFAAYAHANVFTRTWSTNAAHIKILSKFNFETIAVLKDDRGAGVDTVYFKKRKYKIGE